jgi:hypothetical protein
MAGERQMIATSGLRRSSVTAPLVLALITLLGVSGLLWRNTILDTPIYASDEYAYLMSGKFYNHRPAVFQDDPGLQVVPNLLYFRIVNAAFRATHNGWETLRVMNVILYALVGLGFTTIAYRMTNRAIAGGFLFLYFLLPWSGYTASIQPETAAYFSVLLVAIAAVAAIRSSSLLLCVAAGFLTAGSYYIKPNIVGVAVGTAFFLLLYFGENLPLKRRWLFRGLACGGFIASLYLGLLIWRWLAGENWLWLPTFISGLYAYELRQSTGSGWNTAVTCFAYCAGHITVLLMLFPLATVGIIHALRERPSRSETGDDVSWMSVALARWFAWVVCVSIIAVSYYSTKTAGIADFGARLHGRYFGFALPFLLLFSVLCLHNTFTDHEHSQSQHRQIRLSSLLLFAGLLLWECFTQGYFRVYPWDYPELMALFSGQNNYWHESTLWSTRTLMVCAATVTASLLLTGKPFAKYVAIGYLAIWLILGNRNNTAFQLATSRNLGQLTVEARNLTMLAQLDRRRGMVIGAERWGAMSYMLFGVASDVVVRTRPYGSTITPQDVVPGSEWILWEGEYVPQFKYQAMLATPKLKLFLLNRGPGFPVVPDSDGGSDQ